MIHLAVMLFWATQPQNPVDFGRQALFEAAGQRARNVQLVIKQSGPTEGYTISSNNGKVLIQASDAVGEMYGAFEFAERLRTKGKEAWRTNTVGKPFLPERGLNLFLTLPWNYAKNDSDHETSALTDPNRWWFQNDNYWTTLLDLMAHSRLNWLDIHGTWDISVTDAPNLYAYFVSSKTFPLVGVPQPTKEKDLNQLNKVIRMAHARGIKVSLMAYEARMRIPENPDPPYKETDENLYIYTREVVEQMIRRAPGLDAIGFRIGESGRKESFFNCYREAVKQSGRSIPLITRSWITKRQQVLPLARASKDFTVEIKYNGEQWGAPYMVAGGRMANWGSYSFEDYLSDSGEPEKNTKTWPGWPAEGGGNWPANPYKIVWQVRANGTHRIFPFYNPDWVRRSIREMKIGTASGYTIEGEDAYYPKAQQYYLARSADRYVDWIHQRDEMYWMTWGRLGYDPNTPDEVFDARLSEWFGQAAQTISKAWKTASQIVPLCYMAYSLGPDHRDEAPELETGGNEQAFIDNQPFDTLVFKPIHESPFVDDGRIGLDLLVDRLSKMCDEIRTEIAETDALKIPQSAVRRYRELRASMLMLTHLADYYSGRIDAGFSVTALDSRPNTREFQARVESERTLVELKRAGSAWQALSESPEALFYKPFTERLRMHTNNFHWSSELPDVLAEASAPLPPDARKKIFFYVADKTPRDLPLAWKAAGDQIECSVSAENLTRASLLFKPLPSSTFFHKTEMRRTGRLYTVRIDRPACGLCIAAEVQSANGRKWRIPSFLDGRTPYKVVPARTLRTPQIYAANEALTYLDPKFLSPENYGAMLVAPRASTFFRGYSKAIKRKLLEPVERGMTLLILQQDFLSPRYSLDFLPSPLRIEKNPKPNLFDPGGALGLARIDTSDIMWQRFAASPGWEVLGNGALAHMSLGKGQIYVVAGRLMQRMTYPGAAQDLANLLKTISPGKPIVLIDPGTETAASSTSLYPDLLNSLDVPFLTLGEVIAKEQRMNSFTPIPGPTLADDLLGGKGRDLANAFLKGQVEKMAKRPTASTLPEFENLRQTRKSELYRSLGLDPMPAKTPLNAHVTGVIQRHGYRIEKVAFESRPKFYVTAHVYVADGATGHLPVIVNVNGHWEHKKDEDRIQYRCAFQALQGYLAIAIDSPGFSFEGNHLIERRAEGDHNDFALVEGGTNATGYYVWDAIRALDYVATRPDADMSRVGITGASGGGLAALYTFAADDRYKAAVPVVYMSSLELAPDNGCLCNHVPGTCQIGDRSDVIGIQAPKPVLIMGAQNDGEFPPDAMRLTQKKMEESWALFGKGADTFVKIFPGGHDYSQPMRESMIGFFNKYIKGEGDGSPVSEPTIEIIDPEDHKLLALDPPAGDERTMRQLSLEYLNAASLDHTVSDAIQVNGGMPNKTPLNLRETSAGARMNLVFESEPGLQTPAVLIGGHTETVDVFLDDAGKSPTLNKAGHEPPPGLYLDLLGTGELAEIELRYPVYMGKSVAFIGGWQVLRSLEAVGGAKMRIHARGPLSTQAAMWAALMEPKAVASIVAEGCLSRWQDVFEEGVSSMAIQPRAHLCPTLEQLRSKIRNARWEKILR